MTTLEQTTTTLWRATQETSLDEAQLAAAADGLACRA
jgi:hypothetical protein